MNFLVVSDSHASKEELVTLLERHPGLDLYIHCGDSELSSDDPVLEQFQVVRGNCDMDGRLPNLVTVEVAGVTFLVVHGHQHQVKTTLTPLGIKAKEVGADIACFGHSHELGCEENNGTVFLNPGSVRLPRGRKECTYILGDVTEDTVFIQAKEYPSGDVGKFSFSRT
ncbi:metallophosphoesterase family protein [Bacillus fonticola]|uniref:metallophosphoesterase family protein n=1 Tax=Bacillus fonticola TaxID=2728853 RepID=UPI001D1420F8|nr:metallophosphoesterase [Bacillus fonticola]